jgi:hypothetical protein
MVRKMNATDSTMRTTPGTTGRARSDHSTGQN